MAKKTNEPELTFEDALSRLEVLAEELENGGFTLEEMEQRAKEAAKLSAFCQKQIENFDTVIKQLAKDSGSVQEWTDLDVPEETSAEADDSFRLQK